MGAEDGARRMAHDIESVAALSISSSAQNSPDLRLSLASGPAHHGAVDGGWWPRSRDAAAELADLLATLMVPLGAITRLTVDAKDWDDLPRRIAIGDRVVKVGWFPNLDHMIIVTRRPDKFLLLVVPPEAAADAAHRALDQAAAGADSGRLAEILTDCEVGTGPLIADDGDGTTVPRPADGGRPALRVVPSEPADRHRPDGTDGGFQGEPTIATSRARESRDGIGRARRDP